MSEAALQIHNIPPLYDERSQVLILGSFPSVKSREAKFFYGHPQNRFWKVVAALTNEPVPQTVPEKKALALSHGIAMWDVIGQCVITGSSDTSIKDVVPNDIRVILQAAPIRQIVCNGTKSFEMYQKYLLPLTGREAVRLPSTSPANATCSLEKLKGKWADTLSKYLL
ncbi:MAG: DNA-deoxyinosine glycosylase [Lachnospiraceae bacterium]|nr:DNA-deoxyinosine glycosylase [Lachnospiraceae bacterium]